MNSSRTDQRTGLFGKGGMEEGAQISPFLLKRWEGMEEKGNTHIKVPASL